VGLRPALRADLALLSVSAIWGSTFVVVKRALDDASPLTFISLRFLLGAIALGFLFRKEIRPIRTADILPGAILGLFLGTGFALQTIGLLYTTPSRSAFLTGLYVVGVPLIAAALRLRGLNLASIAGVLLALSGLYVMTGGEAGEAAGGFGRGEALTVLCALCFAAHIVGVDVYARRHSVRRIAFWQVAAAGVLSVPFALLAETPRITPTAGLAGAILVTGLGGTALAIAVQNAVQARTTPTHAAIIFASEPVFAAITSFLVEGERLSTAATLGASLILAGMLASELPAARARAGALREHH